MVTFLGVCLGILMLAGSMALGGIGLWFGMGGVKLFNEEVELDLAAREARRRRAAIEREKRIPGEGDGDDEAE